MVAVNLTDWLMIAGLMDEVTVVVVVAVLTVWVSGVDELEAKPPPPVYSAVTEFARTGSEETAIEARPFVTVPLATTVEPSKSKTVPVGLPELAVTRAVNVTACPYTEELSEDVNTVVVDFSADPP